MDLNCPFCNAALAPGASACQACGCVVAGAPPATASPAEPKRLPPAGNEHSRALRERLASDADARSKALGALGHLVRPGRVPWPWKDAHRESKAGKPRERRDAPPPKRGLAALLGRTPAWLVSGVVHALLVAALALITIGAAKVAPHIVLVRGATIPPAFEPLPDLPETGNTDLLKDLDRLDPNPDIPSDLIDKLAETEDGATAPGVREAERLPIGVSDSKYGWRGHAGRRYAAATAGGTWGSEKAVDRGLRWLADHQNREGWWGYQEGIEACTPPVPQQQVGLTGLALLAFLGAGNSPTRGKYAATVKRGFDWLLAQEDDRGGFARENKLEMYHQGIATLAVCEAFGMGAEDFRSPARSALSYVTWAQNGDGGWRYFPRSQSGDTSVTGWCMMALSAARAGNLRDVSEPLSRGRAFLDALTTPEGDVGYVNPENGNLALTAVGLLCKHLAGAAPEDPLQRAAAQRVVEPLPRWDLTDVAEGGGRKPRENVFSKDNPINFYRWYYTSIALIHRHDENWRRWNPACRDLLVRRQRGGDGCVAGSWDPMGVWCIAAGRVYSTAMSVLTLEVYYRAAPAFLAVPDDPLADIPVSSPFFGQELIERAMDAVARARTAWQQDSSRAHAAVAAAEGALERFRVWATQHLERPSPEGRVEVDSWLRMADRQAGELALLRGERDRALALLVPALVRDPDGADAPRVRRLVLRSLVEVAKERRAAGDTAGALEAEGKAARLITDLLDRNEEPDPDRARQLRMVVGDLQARAGVLDAAVDAYRLALDGAEGDLADGLRRKLAAVLLRQHDWSGALETIGALGAGGALDPIVACNAAAALAERIRAEGDPGTAVQIYRDTLERFGRLDTVKVVLPTLRRGLAECLGASGKWGEAADVWLTLVAEGYGNAARLKAADALARGGRADEAIALGARLQGELAPFSPEWWEARCIYAEALFVAGRIEECRELVKNTQLLYPTLGGEAIKQRFLALLMRSSARSSGR